MIDFCQMQTIFTKLTLMFQWLRVMRDIIPNTPPPVGAALQNAFPEITAFTRFYSYGMGNVVVSNVAGSHIQNHYTEKNLLAVDSNFLTVFDFAMKDGAAASCCKKPTQLY